MAFDKSTLRDRILLACVCGVALLGVGQVAPASTPSASTPVPATAAKPVTFHSDLLDLTFSYPASLVAQTLPSLDEQHAAIAAKEPANAPPESRKTDQCTDKALLATRNDDPAAVPLNGDQRGNAPHAITAKILISRIGVACTPASYQNQLDDLAAAMSAALAQDRDLHPIDQPLWFDVGKTRVHFAAGESAPPGNQNGASSAQKTERRWVGSAAMVWNGNLVSIVVESNDLKFFNEMLHGKISFGKGTAVPLFWAEIGNGKPIQPKPEASPDQP